MIVSNKVVYSMGVENEPILHIKSSDQVTFVTKDCYGDAVQSEDFDWSNFSYSVNPATGPVYIEGATPNDCLKISIQKIELASTGLMVTKPNAGVFGDRNKEVVTKIMQIHNHHIQFSKDISIPVHKMIGVIGVAAKESIPCGTPGQHGGNMDCKYITEGAILYLPIFHEGALLAMGDVHASMGDGEVNISGIECAAKVDVMVEVIPNKTLVNPMLEYNDAIYWIASGDTLDEASIFVCNDVRDTLIKEYELERNEAQMLMSAVGDLQICQMVDPLVTVRFKLSKSILDKIKTT